MEKLQFFTHMGASDLEHLYHASNMGKLPDILLNISMLCYYLQRELRQLLGYVASDTKEYEHL